MKLPPEHQAKYDAQMAMATDKTHKLAHLLSKTAKRGEPLGAVGPLYMFQATALLSNPDFNSEMKEIINV